MLFQLPSTNLRTEHIGTITGPARNTDKRNLHNKKPPEIDKQDINFLVCEGGIQEQQNGLSTYIPGKNITEKPIHRGTIQMALSNV